MIASLEGYRDDKGRLEVEVKLDSGVKCVFVIREDNLYEGQLSFTSLPNKLPSWR